MPSNLIDLFSGTKFNSHPHACIIYDDILHYRKVASSFILDGLDKNEKCIMAVDEYHPDSIKEDFERAGVDSDSYLEDGKLTFIDMKSSYAGNSGFDPDSTIKIWQNECNKIISEGYNALRVVGEATFSLGNPDLVDKLIYYETIINEVLFKKFPFKSLCVYNRKLYPLEIIKTAIIAHPILFYNDKLFRENIHYIPPEIYFKDKNKRDEIDIMLKNIQRNNDNLIALKDSETKFRMMFDKAPLSYQSLDEKGNFKKINENWLKVLGYKKEEVIGRNFSEFLHPEWKDHFKENFPRFKAVGEVLGVEFEMMKKDGSSILVSFHGKISKDQNGNFQQTHCIFQDITERKQAEEERKKLQDQLSQAQKLESVGRLAGGVAHDFNNMLGVILGHTELALLQADENHDLYSDLKEIQTAAKRSADITKQLLAFARKQTISPRQLDLNETVESMLNMLRRLIGEDIELIWQPASDLWPVKMDPSQIDQILANLCINARDAISGVGKITIETAKKSFDEEYCKNHLGFSPGDFVMLAVSDNGCGMDKDTLSNLFEPFFTTKDVGKGTGLGLATIYGIVKQNNGFINVDSEPGQGSTFKIYLPRFFADEDTDCKAMPEKKETPGGTETILLVEDEPSILRMTRMMLERKGYTVLTATTPADAMKKAKNHSDSIDLLMTDVVMPGMNGRNLAGQISTLFPDIGLLFMSGYTADVIAHQGVLDAGVAFIQKPFSLADMTEKVREVLDSSSDKD